MIHRWVEGAVGVLLILAAGAVGVTANRPMEASVDLAAAGLGGLGLDAILAAVRGRGDRKTGESRHLPGGVHPSPFQLLQITSEEAF